MVQPFSRWSWLGMALLGSGCLIYNEDLLEDTGSTASTTTATTTGAGGMGGTGTTITTTTTMSGTVTTTATTTGVGGSGAAGGSGAVGGAGVGGTGGSPPVVGVAWINEIHYDNNSGDVDEGAEIAGTAGLDLTGWTIEVYNNGSRFSTEILSGLIPDAGSGFGAIWVNITGLQNGPNDALALVDATNTVVLFVSWEGASTAADGPAAGMMSMDIGVSETNVTPIGESLQLIGTGNEYVDFTWTGPVFHSRGTPNAGQTIQ